MGEFIVMIGGLVIGVSVILIINRSKVRKVEEKRGSYEEDISG
jgi:hypothetical protein